MKNVFYLLLLLVLSNCASVQEARQKRRIAKAEKVLADYKAATPPAQQLAELVGKHPELEGQKVRIVTKTDTVRIPGATITVRIPAESSPATDNILIDSLMRSAATQLHAKDSLAYASRLRAILAARPKLRRDTLVQVLGPLTVRTWVDGKGLPHTTVTSAPQKVAYEKEVHETGPILVKKELAWWERFQLFIKDAAGIIIAMLVLVGGIWLWFFIKRQRQQQPIP
ncbi:hypothetical protein [Hymenobacter negativus]|uniref:DUF3153 domain-containing protein n=1 Tax=Hymenobacter negativus TaxID=2795026 RepID=A0ABS3QHX7_9BACT|nr:hypothetical protein [Hymenobacter negativus]MBO2010841.1 hypothetical protein [Hymenobacter negativus]